jgi:hypothetical protein
MKEQYQAFTAAALLVLAATSVYDTHLFFGNKDLSQGLSFVILLVAIGLLLRGIYCLLPVPLLGDQRARFERAHPEVLPFTREERIVTYAIWQKSEQDAPSDGDKHPV